MSTGMPLSTAVPDSGSSWPPSLSWLTLTPGWSAATPWPGAAAVVTPAVRQRHHAAPHALGVSSTGASSSPPGPLIDGGVGRARVRRRRRDGSAACSGSCRPPARARCASSCCWSADAGGRSARSRRRRRPSESRSLRGVGDQRLRARVRFGPLGVRSTSGSRGCSGPRSMPCGAALSRSQGQAVGIGAERVAVRARAEASCRGGVRIPGPPMSIAVSSSTGRPATGEFGSAVSLASVVAMTCSSTSAGSAS